MRAFTIDELFEGVEARQLAEAPWLARFTERYVNEWRLCPHCRRPLTQREMDKHMSLCEDCGAKP